MGEGLDGEVKPRGLRGAALGYRSQPRIEETVVVELEGLCGETGDWEMVLKKGEKR